MGRRVNARASSWSLGKPLGRRLDCACRSGDSGRMGAPQDPIQNLFRNLRSILGQHSPGEVLPGNLGKHLLVPRDRSRR
eukprot:429458-Amphidinium_carterae.1